MTSCVPHSYPQISDAEAHAIICSSPEPMWIKDSSGRVLWSNGSGAPSMALSEDEARVLSTGRAEVLTSWDGERDSQRLVFRARIQGLPIVVGYSVHF